MRTKINKILKKLVVLTVIVYVLFYLYGLIEYVVEKYISGGGVEFAGIILTILVFYLFTGYIFGFIISALSIAGLIVAPSRKWLILLVISLVFASGSMAIYIDYLQNPSSYVV